MKITTDDYRALNTIYIISKGRPQCRTAQTLTKMDYPGEWFIVVGDNDPTVPEYKEKWGEDRVIVFDWRRYAEQADLLDPFGIDGGQPSGAAPARNAINDISKERGEERHWQLDDDFPTFYEVSRKTKKKVRIDDGERLYRYFYRVAEFGKRARLADVGIDGAAWLRDENRSEVARQVFGVHNLPTGDGFIPWRARMADDICLALEIARRSLGVQLSVRFFGYPYTPSAKKPGGNTDLYNSVGYIRKAGYATLVAPGACKVWFDDEGKPHIRMKYPSAKIIHERYKK